MSKITIKGELISYNLYLKEIRINKFHANTIKQKTERDIMFQLKNLRIQFAPHYPLIMKCTWYTKDKRKDADNVVSAKKFLLDAMVKGGLLPDDGRKYIIGFIDLVKVDKDDPRIEIEFLEMKGK